MATPIEPGLNQPGGVGLEPPLMLSGGVALNDAVRVMIGEATGEAVILPSRPQLVGAYGAALLAAETGG